jgi:hypothetical protein
MNMFINLSQYRFYLAAKPLSHLDVVPPVSSLSAIKSVRGVGAHPGSVDPRRSVVLPNVHGSRLLREFTGQLLPVRSAGVERSGGIRQALDVPSCNLTKALRATYGMLFQVGQHVNDILVIISVRAISTGSTRSTNTISNTCVHFHPMNTPT